MPSMQLFGCGNAVVEAGVSIGKRRSRVKAKAVLSMSKKHGLG
jgi:hypothetical protein